MQNKINKISKLLVANRGEIAIRIFKTKGETILSLNVIVGFLYVFFNFKSLRFNKINILYVSNVNFT